MAKVFTLFLFAYMAFTPLVSYAEGDVERRARLEQELAVIERDIGEKRGVLSEKQKERTSLEKDIAVLDYQIAIAKTQIRHRDLTIGKLQDDISQKRVAIGALDEKVIRNEASLAQIMRRTRELDDVSLAELMLAGSFSKFFSDLDIFREVEQELDASFETILVARADLSVQKVTLEDKRGEEEQLRRIQVLEKQAIEKQEEQKQDVLAVTKGQEKAYQQLIADRERQASVIRSALFELRDSSAIPFGKAYEYAREASAKTDVRPALILAILREETNLGENVGTGNWKKDMKSPRDTEPFKQITEELGLNPDMMPVSRKPSYGWGGAMGPAQFIPSTWLLYKDRIGDMSGQRPPNPWDARTAIFAASLLLMDNGGDKGTRADERLSALRYFAGWTNAKKAAYAFYGDDVMRFADQYQRDIDILEGR